MIEVSKTEFYNSIGQLNVHPHIVSEKYPYTTEWRTPSGEVQGKSIPETGQYPHLYTKKYFILAHLLILPAIILNSQSGINIDALLED